MTASEVAAWWGAGTGTVSAVLLGLRFKWDRGADKRAARAALRAEIRVMVSGAQAELSQARARAGSGTDVGPVGESVAKCAADLRDVADRVVGIRKNANVLSIPSRKSLWETSSNAALAISKAENYWGRLAGVHNHPTVYSEHKRSIAVSEFLRMADPAVDGCRDVLKVLDHIEA